MYLTSLEIEGSGGSIQAKSLQDLILHALYYGPSGFRWKLFSDRDITENITPIDCPETVIRKEEESMELDSVIDEIQTKLCI